jgi:Ca2+-binding EF-hand superfamily protein
MKNNKFKIAVLVFGIMIISNISYGQSQGNQERKEPPTSSELIKQMDSDEDGQLSKSEVKGPIKNDFDTIDKNEDGYLSKEELDNAPKPNKKGKK